MLRWLFSSRSSPVVSKQSCRPLCENVYIHLFYPLNLLGKPGVYTGVLHLHEGRRRLTVKFKESRNISATFKLVP